MRKGFQMLIWGSVLQLFAGFVELKMANLIEGSGLLCALLVLLGGVLLCFGQQYIGKQMPGIDRLLLRRGTGYALLSSVILLAGAPWLQNFLERGIYISIAIGVLVIFWAFSLLRSEAMFRALEQAEALLNRDPGPVAEQRKVSRRWHLAALGSGLAAIILPQPQFAAVCVTVAIVLGLYQALVLYCMSSRY